VRAGNWLPFTPDHWPSIGHAAATLMYSFVGREAIAPLPAFRGWALVFAAAVAVATALHAGRRLAAPHAPSPTFRPFGRSS
jgi:hypothetical protein